MFHFNIVNSYLNDKLRCKNLLLGDKTIIFKICLIILSYEVKRDVTIYMRSFL